MGAFNLRGLGRYYKAPPLLHGWGRKIRSIHQLDPFGLIQICWLSFSPLSRHLKDGPLCDSARYSDQLIPPTECCVCLWIFNMRLFLESPRANEDFISLTDLGLCFLAINVYTCGGIHCEANFVFHIFWWWVVEKDTCSTHLPLIIKATKQEILKKKMWPILSDHC